MKPQTQDKADELKKVIVLLGIMCICLTIALVCVAILNEKINGMIKYEKYTSCNYGCAKQLEIKHGTYSNEGVIAYNKYFFLCKELCEKEFLK